MIGEVIKSAAEVSKELPDATRKLTDSFNPDKRIDVGRELRDVGTSSEKYSPDKRLERKLDRDKIYTTSVERTKMAARSKGEWLGKIGNSEFRPSSEVARKELESFKQTGVKYKDGNPDFSKCSIETVKIKNMTSDRPLTHRRADIVLAEKWSKEGKFGKSEWSRTDVKNWRHENRYSWHERIDKKTMDLVQRDIHDECKHFGGISECKKMEKAGGVFDA